MNREELTEAIHDLVRTQHMSTYALENAMSRLDLEQLSELFDAVADHHDLLHRDVARVLARGVDVDLAQSSPRTAEPAAHRCGHCETCMWRDSAGRCCMDPASTLRSRANTAAARK